MTYNVFSGTLNRAQSISELSWVEVKITEGCRHAVHHKLSSTLKVATCGLNGVWWENEPALYSSM